MSSRLAAAALHCLILLIGTGFFAPLSAHEIRPAYLKLTQLSPAEAERLAGENEDYGSATQFFESSLRQPQIDGRFLGLDLASNCTATQRSASLSDEALIEIATLACGDEGLSSIEILGLDRTMIDTLVSITYLDGSVLNRLITAQESTLDLGTSTAALPVYLLIGFEHLVLGYDHILFVLMLLYLVSRPRQILWVVTSFTLAHSLTLALSALGIVLVAQRPIEAAIAASIVLLAYETLSMRARPAEDTPLSHRFPALVAFSFGLIHGLGFAGALSEIGLPEDSRLGALLLFNIGIELGQIAIVVAALVLLFAVRRTVFAKLAPGARRLLGELPAIAIGGVASYWFIDRALQIVAPLLS